MALRVDCNRPVAALIGSSNLTHQAYSEPVKKFNHETDVLLWENHKIFNEHFTNASVRLLNPAGAEAEGAQHAGSDIPEIFSNDAQEARTPIEEDNGAVEIVGIALGERITSGLTPSPFVLETQLKKIYELIKNHTVRANRI